MIQRDFTTLYKKTSTGAIQYWKIKVFYVDDRGEIYTEYGQLKTDSPQKTVDVIHDGKNAGKKNETTAFEQAAKEAESRWKKQKKKGYVETLEDAREGRSDDIIQGGIFPMLAHKYSEQAHKIKYPACVQPKLDGIRCLATIEKGVCTLWSRTRKPITSVPHIIRAIENVFEGADLILDGELYNHDLKSDFEKIVSLVRQEKPAEGHEVVQYHVYDFAVGGMGFLERIEEFGSIISFIGNPLRLVDTVEVQNEDDMMFIFEKFRSQGYEGLMARNQKSPYVNKRSYDLQKVKEFEDAEFPIVGVEEGRGRMAGHAIFVCETEKGNQFRVKLKGETAALKRYLEDAYTWEGKQLTVQFQGYTGKEGVPRFPVGIAVRDYE